MSRDPRWHQALRIGLVGSVSCALVVGVATTGASAVTPPSMSTAVVAPHAGASDFADRLESEYIDPDRVYSTDVRWWLGEASNTDESLLEEIQALYDGGFRGVELAMQGDAAAPDGLYAYGTDMWTHKWNLMMNKLLDLGMGVYLTSGTNWSTSNVPGLDPSSQSAMQNLTMGTGTVAPGASLTVLPAPPAAAQKAGATFVTAYAYRIVEGDTVDPDSFVDLEPSLSQGADVWTQNVSWTAPSDGTYRVFAMWTQGTYQSSSPSAQPSYATNYFDDRGVQALKSFWEDHYLSDPALVEKFKHGDVQLFMDSLEMHPGGGGDYRNKIPRAPQFTFWAEDLADEFRARKGYDITPHLFLIQGVQSFFYDAYHRIEETGLYRLDGEEELRQGIINDYQDVLTQLYMERTLEPLKEWLNSVGIKTRAQISYGKVVEMSEPIMAVDYPEAENYNQYNQIDIFRMWTGGSKLENKVLSTETGAAMPNYASTKQMDLKDAYSQYAAGFQRIIWHVYGAGYSYGSFQWPGHNSTGFRHFGTRHPGSADYDEFNAHLGRVQQLVQTGESRTDVGFIKQDWVHGVSKDAGIAGDNAKMNWQLAHQGIYYRSTELQNNGYTYDYFSPKFLFDDDVSFNEETQTIEKAGYKAIVLFQNWLDVDGAKRILEWARKGLKVVILEDAGSRTPFNDGRGAELAQVMAELKAEATVRTADVFDAPAAGYFSNAAGGYDDNVMEKLIELGVEPYTGYTEPNLQLLTQTREDGDGNQYVYAYNYGDDEYNKFSNDERVRNVSFGTNIQTEIVKNGQFIPYSIDAWTGQVTELADYEWVDGNTVVPIDLDYNNVALLAFEAVENGKVHITATDADSSRAVADGVAVRATETGSVTTTLSNGIKFQEPLTVPAPYDITDWDLTVESWRPNPTVGDLLRTETIDGLTTTNRKTSTVKTVIDVKLDALKTWNNIPEVGKNVSGRGHYEATFNWDADSASGAYLDFGSGLVETMSVWINGRKVGGDVSANATKVRQDVGGVGKATIDDGKGNQVPLVGNDLHTGGVSWTKPVADVTPYLVDGENEIVIDYNSTLGNLQLSRGIGNAITQHHLNWWKVAVDYREYGPQQAKIVPFVEAAYPGDGFAGVRWHIDRAEQAGELTGNALKQVRKHVDQAEKLTGQAAITQLDNAARKASGSTAVVQALNALRVTLG